MREFDLTKRIFKYPCSYLIYSPAFDSLQEPLREEVSRQLRSILEGKDSSKDYSHLDATIRADILQILRETKPSLFLPEQLRTDRASDASSL